MFNRNLVLGTAAAALLGLATLTGSASDANAGFRIHVGYGHGHGWYGHRWHGYGHGGCWKYIPVKKWSPHYGWYWRNKLVNVCYY